MNWENILIYGTISFIVIFVMTFLNKAASNKPTASANGEYVLRIHKLYNIIGYFVILVGLIGVIAFVVYQETDMIYMVVGLNLFFTPLGILCILWYKNHRLIFNSSEVQTTNWIGKTTTIDWTDIKGIRFNAISGQLVITGRNKKLKAHQHLVGLSEFLRALTNKTNLATEGLKLPFSVKNHGA